MCIFAIDILTVNRLIKFW